MIWKNCELRRLTGQTEDTLGNLDGGEWLTVKQSVCRSTPWTDEQIALEGREVTENVQQFILPMRYEDFPKDCTHVSIDGGSNQEIRQAMDLSHRWTLLQARVYKEGV